MLSSRNSRFVAAVVFQISHGHEVKDFEDRFVRLAEETTHDFSLAAQPGQHLVDSLPLCQALMNVSSEHLTDPRLPS